MPENTDSDDQTDISIDAIIDDEAIDRFADDLGADRIMMPVLVPPLPLEEAREYVKAAGEDEYLSRFIALTDLATAFNRASDPTMPATEEWDDETEEFVGLDEPAYPLAETVPEVKLAARLLCHAYHRELEALASDLGVDDDPKYEVERDGRVGYDHTQALEDYFGYEPDHDYHKPVRDVAEQVDVAPEAVFDALRDEFGEAAERLAFSDELSLVTAEEFKQEFDFDDEEE